MAMTTVSRISVAIYSFYQIENEIVYKNFLMEPMKKLSLTDN
jgi:hypothetical protein